MVETRVKICGITNLEDALCSVAAGADALGFVFYTKSPRYIHPEKVAQIVSKLPPFVTTVGLFVNADPETIRQTMGVTGVNVIQLHGDELPENCCLFSSPVIKAIRVKDAASLTGIDDYKVSALLLDAWNDQQYGGTGENFDWQLAKKLTGSLPVILAGGLTPENVAQAIQMINPYAVDVSSGVEERLGHKDHKKVREFIQKVKAV